MKYFLIFLLSILVFSCNLTTKNQIPTDFPEILMEEFVFPLDVILTEDFDKKIQTISDTNKIILNYSHVRIEYFYSLDGRVTQDETFELNADNNKYFTAGELIRKINRETSYNLKDNNHTWFEGLEFVKAENNVPVYRIAQGS